MSSEPDEPNFRRLSRCYRCFDGSARCEDPLRVVVVVDLMKLPQINHVRPEPAQAIVKLLFGPLAVARALLSSRQTLSRRRLISSGAMNYAPTFEREMLKPISRGAIHRVRGRRLAMLERARHVAPVQKNAIVDPPCECSLVCRRPSLSLYFAKLNRPPLSPGGEAKCVIGPPLLRCAFRQRQVEWCDRKATVAGRSQHR